MVTFCELYKKQFDYQTLVMRDYLKNSHEFSRGRMCAALALANADVYEAKQNQMLDSPDWLIYHVAAMQEEIGEFLQVEKRWKTGDRNTAYNRDYKLIELADIFITAINLGIFSGFTAEEIENAINKKMVENAERMNSKNGDEKGQ